MSIRPLGGPSNSYTGNLSHNPSHSQPQIGEPLNFVVSTHDGNQYPLFLKQSNSKPKESEPHSDLPDFESRPEPEQKERPPSPIDIESPHSKEPSSSSVRGNPLSPTEQKGDPLPTSRKSRAWTQPEEKGGNKPGSGCCVIL